MTKPDTAHDPTAQLVRELEDDRIYACFECGHCASCCPVRRVNSLFSPRKIVHMILLGMTGDLLSGDMIWLCSGCYSCQEACPQGIRITDLITFLKNRSYIQGKAPAGIIKQASLITEQGRLYGLDEFDARKRDKAGLPSLFPKIEEAVRLLEEIR